MQTSRVQQFIAQSIVDDLSKKINSTVSIGHVGYKFFNTISLQEVYIEDLQGDTLLYVDDLQAHFKLFRFFRGEVIFRNIDLDGVYGNIGIDNNGKNNFSFIIEAFSNPNKEKASGNLEYKVNRLLLQNTSFQFNNKSESTIANNKSQNNINFNHLNFEDIHADIILDILNKDTLSAKIKSFGGKERSGFKLVNLKTEITASTSGIDLPYLNIDLPGSHIRLDNIKFEYDSIVTLLNSPGKTRVNAVLQNSDITLNDLSAFVPELKNMRANVSLHAELQGYLSSLNIRDIMIQYGETFRFNANLEMNGLPNINQAFVYATINELRLNANDTESFISDLMQQPFLLPKEFRNLGTINYSGNITGFFSDMVLYGNLHTNIGTISTDLLLQLTNEFKDIKYDGKIKSSELNLGKLLANENLGNMSFYFNTAGTRKMNSSFQGIIDASVPEVLINGYTYHDIRFNGEYDGTGFNGRLSIEDENITASFNGLIDMTQQLPVFDFEIKVEQVNFSALNLITKYPDVFLSFYGKTNMTGNSLDNINGFMSLDSINFRNGDKTLFVDKILFVSRTLQDYTNFSIESKYINGSFSGSFKYSTLPETFTYILSEYLPALEDKQRPVKVENNRIDVDLTVTNTSEISHILNIPYAIGGTSTVKGSIDEKEDKIDIVVNVPKFLSGEQHFNNNMVHIWGENHKLDLIVESNIPTQQDFWNFSLYSSAQNDTLAINIDWRNRQQVINRGEIKTITGFNRNHENKIEVFTSVLPTEIIISDMLWNLSASAIDIKDDKSIYFDDFRFGNESQYLNIDGIASKNQSDSLQIEMKEVDLGLVSLLASMKGFTIGGEATGKILLYGLLERPVFNAAIGVINTKFNSKRIGDTSVFATWDQQNEQIVAIAEITDKDETIALGECVYSLKENNLTVDIDAFRVDIDFLTRYFESILPDSKGFASGKLRIGGPLNAIRFDGRLKVTDGEVTVGVLDSKFRLNDSILMTPYTIEFPNITLYDVENNPVNLNGVLNHNGAFKNMSYNLNVQTKNALVMNLKPGDSNIFFGKAYGEGTVRISGNDEATNIRVNAKTKPGTKAYIQMASNSEATDAGFIQFVEHPSEEEEDVFLVHMASKASLEKKTNVILNLQLEVTPDAEIEFIIDPVGGDMISGKGSGNIRIEQDNSQSDVKMYGSYEIESGNYLFTLQDVFRKDFKIEKGSTIRWSGGVTNAQVDIKAIYSLTASLKDLLDETILSLSSTSRTAVPVNCILLLTGNLLTPNVEFQIDLPSSDEGLKQLVRNAINTEEMMTRQMLYLLVFNKFYTETNNSVFNIGTNEFRSLASSTVSSQLNNILSQIWKNNTISIGFDWRRSDEINNEYEFDLTYQPNSKWIVNGNFGYRENRKMIDNFNQFITDVDIEYLLTESGKIRLKAYNHTIDRTTQLLRTAKNTQGVGIMYKEDFDSVGELFRYYWRLVANIGKKKKNKENEQEPAEK